MIDLIKAILERINKKRDWKFHRIKAKTSTKQKTPIDWLGLIVLVVLFV